MKCFLVVFFIHVVCFSEAQTKSEAESTYDLGVNFFSAGDWKMADSMFSASIKLEPNPDAFFNKAVVSKKLGNFSEYCDNLEYASWYGDSHSKKLFDSDCHKVDSFYVTKDYKKATPESYYYKLKFIKSIYSTQQEFHRLDSKNQIDLSYEIDRGDTSYMALPAKDWELVSENVEKPIADLFRKKLHYPEQDKSAGVQGIVLIQLYINKKGNVGRPKVLKIPKGGVGLAAETLRVFYDLRQVEPVTYQGKPINLKLYIPVKFEVR